MNLLVGQRTSVNSLLSLTVEYLVNNLALYEKSCLQSLAILPNSIKNRLLKKFVSTSYFARNVNFLKVLETLANKETEVINLTAVLVNDEVLNILSRCIQLKKIHFSSIGDNCKFTSEALINLLLNVPNLQYFVLMRCYAVNDNVLKQMSKSCPNLKGIDIGGCCVVTDEGIKCLRDFELQWLRISRTMVSDVGIEYLVKGKCGKSLTELMIDNCVHVTSTGITLISHKCPNLTVFSFFNCCTDLLATDLLTFKYSPKQLCYNIPL